MIMRGWIKEWRKNLNYQRFYISNDSRMHDAQLTEASGSCHWNIFLSSSCSMWWKMFPQVEVWRLDSRVTRVISNRIFPPVKCWMPRVTTGTVTVTISNLQNTRFHRYSPVLEFKAIASFRHISVDCPLFTASLLQSPIHKMLVFYSFNWFGEDLVSEWPTHKDSY